MRRLPLLPTLIVGAAIALMITLGLWQLRRAEWKDALLDRYQANASLPAIEFPLDARSPEDLLYRPARGLCIPPVKWSVRAGRSRSGESGWRHIAVCRDGRAYDMGWSREIGSPAAYRGGAVAGVLDADRDQGLLLIAERPAPGLAPSALPSPADIPNNHRGYAAQWFIFAAVALVIYGLALARRKA